MDYVKFSLVMLAAQFSPGPDMLLLLKNALGHPLRTGIFTVLGIAAGLSVHSFCVISGLSVIIRDRPPVFKAVTAAGGIYLAWLAVRLLRSVMRKPDPATVGETEAGAELPSSRSLAPVTDKAAFMQGLLTNLLNPKAAVFILTVVAAGLGHNPPAARQAVFFLIIVGQAVIFWSLFVCLLQQPSVARLYMGAERPINLVFGLLLLLVAGQALWSV